MNTMEILKVDKYFFSISLNPYLHVVRHSAP